MNKDTAAEGCNLYRYLFLSDSGYVVYRHCADVPVNMVGELARDHKQAVFVTEIAAADYCRYRNRLTVQRGSDALETPTLAECPPDVNNREHNERIINRARTESGGWLSEQLEAWGVPWPPPTGWRKRLIQGPALPDEPPVPRRVREQPKKEKSKFQFDGDAELLLGAKNYQ